MELMIGENFIHNKDLIPIVITSDKIVNYFLKGYHAYKELSKPFINEELTTTMEPVNIVDKYAVSVKKNDAIVGHLPHSKNGRFPNMIFYFLRADYMQNANWKGN